MTVPTSKSGPNTVNRLAAETSPYLLQHRHNPVDWYPWGPEAFDRARREQKPIFLSVGYSTCYWCHVMERQSFENEQIAELMNRLFVCIKVDREERPDVDQLYMAAVQLIARQGGWPMSVFLTPDLRPFYGGTYYPPTDNYGRPGFPRICQAVYDAWTNRRGEVEESCQQILSLLQRLARPTPAEAAFTIDASVIGSLIDRSTADYEPHFGGFGHAPKFPRETVIELLLTYLASDWDEKTTQARTPKAKVRQMTLHALDAMMHGGIRDHLGGGFHRYSTDAKWLVPHFEIMLYDNAMLLGCYAEAYRQTGDARYAQVARDIADFILREMTSPDGAFYTAMDAEVDGQEGLNYLWTHEQAEAALAGETADEVSRFLRAYGLDQGPNFADPHHGSGVPDKNILFIAHPTADGAKGTSPLLDAGLRRLRQKLYEVRQKRKQPLLDTKVITSWNGLMIRGLAIAGRTLNEARYTQAAARCADFLLSHHRMEDGGLYRTSRDGVKKYAGFLDDCAFLAWALTDLAAATSDNRWRDEAGRLCDAMTLRFGDDALSPSPGTPGEGRGGGSSERMKDEGRRMNGSRAGPPASSFILHPSSLVDGFFFTDRSADDLIVRQKTATDSPLPSGNAAAAMALLALGRTGEATQTVAAFAPAMLEQGESMSSMVQAALLLVRADGEFTVQPAAAEPVERMASLAEVARDVVDVSARWPSPRELVLLLTIADGWHINAHEPDVTGLVGLTVSVDPADRIAGIGYPQAEPLRAEFATEPVRVHSGAVQVWIHFSDDVAPEQSIAVTVGYQACDDKSCLPAATKRIETARGQTETGT